MPPAPALPGLPPRSRWSPGSSRKWRARSPRRAASSTGSLAVSGSMCTGPTRSPTAASSSCVTSATGRSGARGCAVHDRRCARPPRGGCAGPGRRPARRSRRAPAGAGFPSPRPVRRRAACWSCGSGGGERHRELAEDLGVRVQGVAGGAPRFVGKRRPCRGHRRHPSHEGTAWWEDDGPSSDELEMADRRADHRARNETSPAGETDRPRWRVGR